MHAHLHNGAEGLPEKTGKKAFWAVDSYGMRNVCLLVKAALRQYQGLRHNQTFAKDIYETR